MADYEMTEGPENRPDSGYGPYQKPSYEQRYNPTHMPKPDEPMHGFPCKDYCCMGASPGGTETRHMWDEKAGLDQIVLRQTQFIAQGYMNSEHDGQRQGIYKTNSAGDYD
jgi:hypothetical protein